MSASLVKIGELAKPLGGGLKLALLKATLGTYSSGGVSVTVEGFSKVYFAMAQSSGPYTVVASASGSDNTITLAAYYYDYDAAADGTAIEVPDGTDLSSVTVGVLVVGE